MFNTRYFAPTYFTQSYFPKIGETVSLIQYGYFPHNYFAARYFTNSYFPGSRFDQITPPDLGGVFDYIIFARRRGRR